ncbi:MAG: sensor histidine kinase [Symploca sp. SIO3C6]|uniref:histidine kinase n=1 Tax=Symploca sp. SIO1C4 TaxID=2607765 RepID=A0A6B3NC53_9CYAN|nr:sensor histidine kinase [Symploca sp. SIO3C6]NER27634.1 sensor histidine kinase [Symploca sp. SIO1C4]
MFQTTRRRLALWYTAITAVLLLLFATGVYMYVRNTLIERVDDTLKHVAEVVERSLVIQPEEAASTPYQLNLEVSFRNNAQAVEDDHIDLEWFSPTGELLWSTLSEHLALPVHLNPGGETVHLSSNYLLRQVTKRVQFGRHVLGYLRVSHPWFEVTKPSRQLIVDLSVGIVAMVMSTAAIGWWLSGLAIKPVRESYQRLKQFTADASHELRNPIAMIQTNVQVALADPDWEPQLQRQQLKVLERLTQRLGRLVNDLLFLARVDSGMVQLERQPVHLDALLIEVIEEQQLIALQKGIFLSLHLVEMPSKDRGRGGDGEKTGISNQGVDGGEDSSGFPGLAEDAFTIKGDWNQLARLFTNLVSNAVQYTPALREKPKEASVQVELQRLKGNNYLRGRRFQSLVRVQVRDNGVGMPQSALPHIFDRFYRADPARKYQAEASSGLGLAIAKAIVENHHAQIEVESALDQGTTVTVTFASN